MSGEYDQRIAKIEQSTITTLQIVKNLEMALVGNCELGIDGVVNKQKEHDKYIAALKEKNIIKKVERHETYIDNDKKRKWMIAGAITFASGLISAALTWLKFRGG